MNLQLYIAYFSMGGLILIFGSMSIRYGLFLSIWIVTGHSFWLFPNLLSDDVQMTECLIPRISYDRNKDDHMSLLKRGSIVGFIMLVVYFLSEHGPDRAAVKMFTFKAHDQVLSMLKVQNANLTMITDATEDINVISDEELDKKNIGEGNSQPGEAINTEEFEEEPSFNDQEASLREDEDEEAPDETVEDQDEYSHQGSSDGGMER